MAVWRKGGTHISNLETDQPVTDTVKSISQPLHSSTIKCTCRVGSQSITNDMHRRKVWTEERANGGKPQICSAVGKAKKSEDGELISARQSQEHQ